MEYIREHVDKDQQQVQFTQLLEEEIRLLNEIEKKRNKIRKEAYDKHMDKMLDKMGEPIKWIGYKSKWEIILFALNFKRRKKTRFLFQI